jgi:hypothetical protein
MPPKLLNRMQKVRMRPIGLISTAFSTRCIFGQRDNINRRSVITPNTGRFGSNDRGRPCGFYGQGSGRRASCFSKRSQRRLQSCGIIGCATTKRSFGQPGVMGQSGPLPVVTAWLGSPLPGEISGLAPP